MVSLLQSRLFTLRRLPRHLPILERDAVVPSAGAIAVLGLMRLASTRPDVEAPRQLMKAIIDGHLSEILSELRKSSPEVLDRPKIRDILCRIGSDNVGLDDAATKDARRTLLDTLVKSLSKVGLSEADATLIARGGARTPWTSVEVLSFLDTLRQAGLKPTVGIYEHLMDACLMANDPAGAEKLLGEMAKDKVSGNARIFGALSETFVNQGRKQALERLLGDVKKKN